MNAMIQKQKLVLMTVDMLKKQEFMEKGKELNTLEGIQEKKIEEQELVKKHL